MRHPVRLGTALLAIASLTLGPRPLAAQYLTARQIDSLPSRPADARIAYGTDSLQFGDLRLPPGSGPFPVAIVVHGGCWVAQFASLHHSAAMADALRREGIATWNIEYRRLGQAGGGWPGTFIDVAEGADHLRSLAQKYPLDLTRVVAVGHSAGGHLALWLAARHRLPRTSPLYREHPIALGAVVSLGGPGDLKEFIGLDQKICDGPVIAQLMGGSPDVVPDHYAQGSPVELLPFGVRQVLLVGDHDPVMPAKARDHYAARARAAGDSVEVVVIPNAAHHEVVAPTTEAWRVVRDVMRRLVAGQVGR